MQNILRINRKNVNLIENFIPTKCNFRWGIVPNTSSLLNIQNYLKIKKNITEWLLIQINANQYNTYNTTIEYKSLHY